MLDYIFINVDGIGLSSFVRIDYYVILKSEFKFDPYTK